MARFRQYLSAIQSKPRKFKIKAQSLLAFV